MAGLGSVGLPVPFDLFRQLPVVGQVPMKGVVRFAEIEFAAMNAVEPIRQIEKSGAVVALPAPEKSVLITVMATELFVEAVITKEPGPGKKQSIEVVTDILPLLVEALELVDGPAGVLSPYQLPQRVLGQPVVEISGENLVCLGHDDTEIAGPPLIPADIAVDAQKGQVKIHVLGNRNPDRRTVVDNYEVNMIDDLLGIAGVFAQQIQQRGGVLLVEIVIDYVGQLDMGPVGFQTVALGVLFHRYFLFPGRRNRLTATVAILHAECDEPVVGHRGERFWWSWP